MPRSVVNYAEQMMSMLMSDALGHDTERWSSMHTSDPSRIPSLYCQAVMEVKEQPVCIETSFSTYVCTQLNAARCTSLQPAGRAVGK